MATLKDVAKLACVDVSTVSRALNNTSYVHPETKAKVYAAAKELGYHPNLMAKALRQGRRHAIGVCVPRLYLAIFAEIVQGIERKAREKGYSTIISVMDDNSKLEKECLEQLRYSLIDGLIVASTGRNNRLLRDIQASGIAVAQIIRCQEPRVSSIVADYEACGREAVDYLYRKGCRQIGIIAGSLHLAPYKGRYDGYCKGIEHYGLEIVSSEVERPVNSFEYGYECTMQLLQDNPELDAIVAAVDIQSLGVMRALKEYGKKVPEEVKVMSLTGHAVGGMLQTSVTSLEMPAHEMGEKAVEMVLSDIEHKGDKKPSARHITFPYTLVEREST